VTEQRDKPPDAYFREYRLEMEAYIARIRKDYLRYAEQFGLDGSCAVVDIGYYGNNQRYLNKLLGTDMAGYYFNADLSDKNTENRKMAACFQSDGDITGENSRILRKQIYLESFLTAPYGMIRSVDENGNFLCAPDGKNQEHFREKEEINEGVKCFIADYAERFGGLAMVPDRAFADTYYGICFGGGMEFADEVKESFYNDNAMMNRIESNLFC
ncbi:MAG: hypothetical protein NC489_42425, partial [Ruminococcus flavefaciens]|nr:hypothetical protein [Ruminococcus flavefaciens]